MLRDPRLSNTEAEMRRLGEELASERAARQDAVRQAGEAAAEAARVAEALRGAEGRLARVRGATPGLVSELEAAVARAAAALNAARQQEATLGG